MAFCPFLSEESVLVCVLTLSFSVVTARFYCPRWVGSSSSLPSPWFSGSLGSWATADCCRLETSPSQLVLRSSPWLPPSLPASPYLPLPLPTSPYFRGTFLCSEFRVLPYRPSPTQPLSGLALLPLCVTLASWSFSQFTLPLAFPCHCMKAEPQALF